MSGLERAFFGDATREQIDGWVTAQVEELLAEPVAGLCLRAGRIDAVYGLRLGADRVVMKVHRPPVDLRALGAAVENGVTAAGKATIHQRSPSAGETATATMAVAAPPTSATTIDAP